MKKNYGIMATIFLFGLQSVSAQVLWSDDFDGHTVGALSSDPSGNTAGQGNWYVWENGGANVVVTFEPNRGNVLAMVCKFSNFKRRSRSYLQTTFEYLNSLLLFSHQKYIFSVHL